MKTKKLSLFLIVFIAIVSMLFAQKETSAQSEGGSLPKVFEKKGCIYFSSDAGHETQVTQNGKDRAPILSLDGKVIVFIRKSNDRAYLAVGSEEDYKGDELLGDQIWAIGSDGKNEKLLVKDKHSENAVEGVVAHIDDASLQFSPDGQKIYFITSAWATSGAVHQLNTHGSGESYLVPGNSLKVIDRGQYKGHLIVNQHRYFVSGGSYDWLWLFKPDGKEVGPLGPELNQSQQDLLLADAVSS